VILADPDDPSATGTFDREEVVAGVREILAEREAAGSAAVRDAHVTGALYALIGVVVGGLAAVTVLLGLLVAAALAARVTP
jgi:hypothetical protein